MCHYIQNPQVSHYTAVILCVIQCKAVDGSPELRLPASVADIMNRWVLQMGYPLVTIDTTTGTISQKHFLLDPNAVVQRPSIYK